VEYRERQREIERQRKKGVRHKTNLSLSPLLIIEGIFEAAQRARAIHQEKRKKKKEKENNFCSFQ
jgi:hypothetical protein